MEEKDEDNVEVLNARIDHPYIQMQLSVTADLPRNLLEGLLAKVVDGMYRAKEESEGKELHETVDTVELDENGIESSVPFFAPTSALAIN